MDKVGLNPRQAERSVRILNKNHVKFEIQPTIDGWAVVASDTGRPVATVGRSSRAHQIKATLTEAAMFGPVHVARAIATLGDELGDLDADDIAPGEGAALMDEYVNAQAA